jgi:hypothetical protein
MSFGLGIVQQVAEDHKGCPRRLARFPHAGARTDLLHNPHYQRILVSR